MSKKALLWGVLCISLVVALGSGAFAGTKVCLYRDPILGTCRVWSGSIECGISANGLGNVLNDPVTLACTVLGGDPTFSTYWAVACGNPGSNTWTAPGINLVYFSAPSFGGYYTLQPGDVTKNGNAYASAYAYVPDDILQEFVNLGACPNDNWTAIDAVPCQALILDEALDAEGCTLSEAVLDCTLPDCATLGWDSQNGKFERREYNCTLLSRTTYRCP